MRIREAVKKIVFLGIYPQPADPHLRIKIWILAKFTSRNVNFMAKKMATKISQKVEEYQIPPPIYLGIIPKKQLLF